MLKFKEKITQKEVVLGTMLSEVYTPNITRVMKEGGIQFIIVDSEHGYFDFSQMANLVSVCNGFDLPVIIRVPNNDREFITKALDMGANGILIPMVNNVEDARQAVKYAKYAPVGQRGLSVTRAHSNYNPGDLSAYIKTANKETVILAQIESQEALLNSAEIASVEGIDALIIGPNDLAMDMGIPGDFENETMNNAIETVVKATKKANKSCGIVSSDIKFLHECREKGMSIFSCNSEVGMILKYTKHIVKEFCK